MQDMKNMHGMTLVEVMVSLTLTTLIVGLVSLMMSQSDRQFRYVSQQENIERQVRVAQGSLTDLFRKEAIAEVLPTPTPISSGATTPNPNEPTILFHWKNAVGDEGQLQLLAGNLQWNKAVTQTANPTQPGSTPYVMNNTFTIAEQLTNVTPQFNSTTQQLSLLLEWQLSDGTALTHQWAYTLQRWDQPVIPTPSESPSPSPSETP